MGLGGPSCRGAELPRQTDQCPYPIEHSQSQDQDDSRAASGWAHFLFTARESGEREPPLRRRGAYLPRRPPGGSTGIRCPTGCRVLVWTMVLVPRAGGRSVSHPSLRWRMPWAFAMALPRKTSRRTCWDSVPYVSHWQPRTTVLVPDAGAPRNPAFISGHSIGTRVGAFVKPTVPTRLWSRG